MLEQPVQIAVRIDTIGFEGFNETIKIRAGMRAGNRIGKQEALTCNGKLVLILPISGKKLKSIIAGIRCMVTASRFETSSNVAAAVWCMSKPPLA